MEVSKVEHLKVSKQHLVVGVVPSSTTRQTHITSLFRVLGRGRATTNLKVCLSKAELRNSQSRCHSNHDSSGTFAKGIHLAHLEDETSGPHHRP